MRFLHAIFTTNGHLTPAERNVSKDRSETTIGMTPALLLGLQKYNDLTRGPSTHRAFVDQVCPFILCNRTPNYFQQNDPSNIRPL